MRYTAKINSRKVRIMIYGIPLYEIFLLEYLLLVFIVWKLFASKNKLREYVDIMKIEIL